MLIKEKWVSQKRSGRGGGVEYAFDSLPADVQAEIKAKQIRAMLPKVEKPSVPALLERDLGDLTHEQRATADARFYLLKLKSQRLIAVAIKPINSTKHHYTIDKVKLPLI